jgi:hypothetical protein
MGRLQNSSGTNGVYGGNVEIIAVTGLYKVFVSVYFASEGQITEPPTFIGQVVAVTKISLLFMYFLMKFDCNSFSLKFHSGFMLAVHNMLGRAIA